jgi:hypothetical protein
LPGLPSLSDPHLLRNIVQGNLPRFFRQNGVPLALSSIRVDGIGDAWAAVVEQRLLASIQRACERAKFKLAIVVPSLTARGLATHSASSGGLQSHTVEMSDGATRYLLTYDRQRLTTIARATGPVPTPGDSELQGGERQIVTADLSYDGAIGAARSGKSAIAWRDLRTPTVLVSVRSRAAAFLAVASTGLAVLFAQGASASLAARDARVQLRTHASQQGMAIATVDTLRHVTEALNELAEFAAARRPVTRVLAHLTDALPAASAIIAAQVDTTGASLTVITPSAVQLVGRLSHDPDVAGVEIIGPVARESVQSPSSHAVQLERVIVRIHFAESHP